jgi:hypothetical protein
LLFAISAHFTPRRAKMVAAQGQHVLAFLLFLSPKERNAKNTGRKNHGVNQPKHNYLLLQGIDVVLGVKIHLCLFESTPGAIDLY